MIDSAEIRKRLGIDEHGCLCCEVSNCCMELPDVLDEIDRLCAEVRLKDAVVEAARGVACKPEFTASLHDWAELFRALKALDTAPPGRRPSNRGRSDDE